MKVVGWAAAALMLSAGAGAEEWETISSSGGIVVKTRTRPHSAVREVIAEGDVDAEIQDVQSTIMDAEAYPGFMPYMKESRYVGEVEEDGGRVVYARMDLPFVAGRDYVVKVFLEKSVSPDGKGEFKNRWISVPDRIPARSNIVRLRTDEGSWAASQGANGKVHLVYAFAVDPGSWVPTFVIDMGNKKGVAETFSAIEKESRRRGDLRRSQNEVAGAGAVRRPVQ